MFVLPATCRLAAAAAASSRALTAAAWRLRPLALTGATRPLATLTRPVLARAGTNAHDAKLSSLLESELRFEKSAAAEHQAQNQRQQVPQPPQGFTVTARDGTQFTLTRKCPDDGSLLEVTFDLNGSTASPPDHDDVDGEEDETASPDTAASGRHGAGDGAAEDAEAGEEEAIQSRPDLIFRVRKPSSQACLAVHCSFPPAHVSRQMAAEDPDYPSLSIDTVAVEGAAGAELGAYELEADMLNDDLYKQLAEMLVHRGVTRDFENALVEFCTAQEHQVYLRFLAEAKKFCDA